MAINAIQVGPSRNLSMPTTTENALQRGNKALFEQRRAELVGEITTNLESVLQNINKLNRSLEGITAVGTEFSHVEALWSHFESVMANKDAKSSAGPADDDPGHNAAT